MAIDVLKLINDNHVYGTWRPINLDSVLGEFDATAARFKESYFCRPGEAFRDLHQLTLILRLLQGNNVLYWVYPGCVAVGLDETKWERQTLSWQELESYVNEHFPHLEAE